MIHKFILLLTTCLFVLGNLFSQTEPNIVLIIADDMGWNQVSGNRTTLVNGNTYPSDFYETPIIDNLALEGIAFPNAYVNGANCAPTRAAILTGQYASRPSNNIFNVEDLNRGNTVSNSTLIGPQMGLATNNNIDEIPSIAITLAESLKVNGYVTAHFGKYHVGEYEDTNVSNNAPTDQGFDFNYGGGTDGGPGSGGYFALTTSAPFSFGAQVGPELDVYADPYSESESQLLAGDSSLTGTNKHLTDALTEAALDFMANNSNSPFFMHFSNYAIHGPFNSSDARPDLRAKYDAKAINNPSSMDHDSKPGQAALAEGMDQAIGRLINYLKLTDDPRNPGQKLSENTIVYFISDNGDAIKRNPQSPLRGMKGEYYEGGIRSVTFAWSEASWLVNKGTVNSTPVIAFDLYPTFVEASGGVLPNNYDIDGVSQWQMLTDGTAMNREAIFWHFPGYLIDSKRDSRPVSVVRKGDYKLRFNYETLSYQLFNLTNDLGETTNLLEGTPNSIILTIANDMSYLLRNHLIDTNAPLPTYRSDGTTVPLPYIISGGTNSTVGCQATNGYEAYWDFDSANNNIVEDISGNSNNPIAVIGTLIGDTLDFIEGDQSIYFDGATNVRYDNSSFLKPGHNSRSVSVWIKPSSLSGAQNIFDEGGATKGVALRLNSSDLEFIVRANSSNFEQISAPFPNDGEWHHVAFVYDGSNTIQKLYIDGIEVASSTSAPNSIGNHSGSGIAGKIGGADSFGNTLDNFFTGKMDAFAVYDIVLNQSQVEASACLNQVMANAGPDVSICDGSTAILTASGGDSYLWSTGATTASINISPSTTTTYTVTAYVNGNSGSDEVVVTVNPVPTADAGADVTICEGDSTTLIASGGDSYLWNTGETTASINVNPVSTSIYSVTVTANGCSDDDTVTVNVNPKPNVIAGNNISICFGESTTLTATGGDNYLWNTGATSPSINVSPNSTTIYTVTASTNGCSATDSVTVSVITQTIADAGSDVTICEGDSTTLTASGGDSYLWSTGETTASINVSPNLTTTYSVTVSKIGCGVSDSDDVTVTVNPIPNANAGSDVTICEGNFTTLTASGGDSYLWSTGETAASINVNPISTTAYTVTVTTDGCSSNDDVIVNVTPLPNANAGSDVTITEGGSTTLTASGGDTYLWSTGATTESINVSPTSDTTYSVTVTTNGCSSFDDVIITVVQDGCTYKVLNSEGFETGWGIWNDGGSDARRSSNDAIYATTGTYCIRLRDNTDTSVMTTNNLDLSSYEELTIDFGYYPQSMDNIDEDFWLQISTNGGSSYTTVEEWNLNDEFINDQFYTDQVVISGPFTANTKLRFRADGSGNNDIVYIDDVVINACSNSAEKTSIMPPVSIEIEDSYNRAITGILYPNPFVDNFNIQLNKDYKNANIKIFNILGQMVYSNSFNENEAIKVFLENIESGHYFVRIMVDDETITKRAIKR